MKRLLIPIIAAAIALPALAADKDKIQEAPSKQPPGTYLGVAMDEIPPLTQAQLDIPKGVGVAVSFVVKDSPAHKAGLKANDIITRLNEQLIINAQQLQTLIKTKKVDEEVTLTYYRKGKKQTTKAKLAKGKMIAQGDAQPQPLRWQNGQWQHFPFLGGLGMMRQFNLNPQNQGEFQRRMDELKKQLEQFENMNPEDWKDMFGQGRGIPRPGNLAPFRFDFDFNLPKGNGGKLNPGNGFGFNAQTSSSMTISDEAGTFTLTINNGKKRLKAKDAEGIELFDGPVDTEKQRDGLDVILIQKLRQLEGMAKGKGGINLNGNRFNKQFRFEFPPRNNDRKKKKDLEKGDI
tara:strand:+ start:100 stop:1140 length:1041 start_codon:yes stop_codon:yes gene_type:complete